VKSPNAASRFTVLPALSALCGLLALPAAPAAAGWVLINEHADYFAYADPATIARAGDLVRMSDLIALKLPKLSPYGVKHHSSVGHSEFDCENPRMRTLAFALHAGRMGEGDVVEAVPPSAAWMPVFSGTLLEMLRRFACS
jgi:hypothetical protein